jgi:hypothetical protein
VRKLCYFAVLCRIAPSAIFATSIEWKTGKLQAMAKRPESGYRKPSTVPHGLLLGALWCDPFLTDLKKLSFSAACEVIYFADSVPLSSSTHPKWLRTAM